MDIGFFQSKRCSRIATAWTWLQLGHACLVRIGFATVSVNAWQRSCNLAELAWQLRLSGNDDGRKFWCHLLTVTM
jgi:hypothetical protein